MRPPGDYPPQGRRPAVKKRNIRIAAEHGCVLTGRSDGIDPAHYPVRRSHGATWGLLEFLPLSRHWHTRYDLGDPLAVSLVALCSVKYYGMMYRRYKDDPSVYLGPPWRIQEIEEGL